MKLKELTDLIFKGQSVRIEVDDVDSLCYDGCAADVPPMLWDCEVTEISSWDWKIDVSVTLHSEGSTK